MTTPHPSSSSPQLDTTPAVKRLSPALAIAFLLGLCAWSVGWFSIGDAASNLGAPRPLQSSSTPNTTQGLLSTSVLQPRTPTETKPTSPPYEAQRFDRVDSSLKTIQPPHTVRQLIARRKCSTGPATPLNTQIASEINCAKPNLFTSIADIPNVNLEPGANPFLQHDAAESLRSVAAALPFETLSINSSWRSVVQQHILKRWQGSCGVSIAANPGQSRHESGLAIDLPLESIYAFHSELKDQGWRWYCDATNRGDLRRCRDVPHYSFSSGEKINRHAIAAFQRLWNRAHPDDTIPVSGAFTNATAKRLNNAPLAGFETGTTCGESLQSEACPSSFRDVSVRYTWWNDIESATRAGWIPPCKTSPHGDLFCPSAGVTRGDFADALQRTLQLPDAPASTPLRFVDVSNDHPHRDAIYAVAHAGISLGCNAIASRFCPDAPPTWGQAAAWVTRARNVDLIPPKGQFKDVSKKHWAAPYIEHVHRAGWMQGCNKKGRFCPNWRLSRARLAELLVHTFGAPVDVSCDAPIRAQNPTQNHSSPIPTHSNPDPQARPDGVH